MSPSGPLEPGSWACKGIEGARGGRGCCNEGAYAGVDGGCGERGLLRCCALVSHLCTGRGASKVSLPPHQPMPGEGRRRPGFFGIRTTGGGLHNRGRPWRAALAEQALTLHPPLLAPNPVRCDQHGVRSTNPIAEPTRHITPTRPSAAGAHPTTASNATSGEEASTGKETMGSFQHDQALSSRQFS